MIIELIISDYIPPMPFVNWVNNHCFWFTSHKFHRQSTKQLVHSDTDRLFGDCSHESWETQKIGRNSCIMKEWLWFIMIHTDYVQEESGQPVKPHESSVCRSHMNHGGWTDPDGYGVATCGTIARSRRDVDNRVGSLDDFTIWIHYIVINNEWIIYVCI